MFQNEYEGGYYSDQRVEHHFQLNGPIQAGEFSDRLLRVLYQADDSDTITIHINSPGGSLSTTSQIVTAMRECKGRVICSAEGNVYSGAALLFFSGHELMVHDLADFMVHDASGISAGKLSDTGGESDHARGLLSHAYYDTLVPFLEHEEVERVLEGRDKWMLADEVRGRIDRVVHSMSDNNNKEVVMKIVVDKRTPMSDKIIGFVKANDLNKLLDIVDIRKDKKIADHFGVHSTPTLISDSEVLYQGYGKIKSYLKGFTGRELKDV